MGLHTLQNVRIFAGGADLTSQSNKCELSASVEKKPTTVFGADGWVSVAGTVASGSIKASGFWTAGAVGQVDDDMFANLGANAPWSVYPSAGETAAASAGMGSTCYFTNGLDAQYKFLGALGDIAPWEGSVESSWPLVRGLSIHPPGTARIATGSGAGQQHVAVTTGLQLYAALHVLSVSGTGGPTITVKVQSSPTNTWGSPTDRITFTAATALGGQISRSAGANTDTWYRVAYTIAGSSPSFLFVVSLGIAP